ncbi:hypothetical protein VY88_01250 [Azospirillum thiophilum]|uniref:Uncharacterized protein n=1 Tax=Azospirillum thiophilum TaxID=528244 RepID=A0AAC8VXQ5_9PROT|nr:hypothetical protein [Azospirillum thiophilum]ALG71429.1 hypothetical protein AL072_11460 [Azospirillum thiophilum]KJR64922.1 hypothetical protein VY88_01250 [Azospirillum thiophilum]
MSTLSLHRDGHSLHGDTPSLHPVRDFIADWLEATPAAILLHPVGAFLTDWANATPAAILFHALHH